MKRMSARWTKDVDTVRGTGKLRPSLLFSAASLRSVVPVVVVSPVLAPARGSRSIAHDVALLLPGDQPQPCELIGSVGDRRNVLAMVLPCASRTGSRAR